MKAFRFYLIAACIVVADQLTKHLVMTTIPFGESRRALGPVMSLTPTANTGGAFSLFQARNGAFVIIAIFAAVAITVAYHRFQRADLWASAALAMALGGAVGNLIDRMRFHYVQDFFDIAGAQGHVWPIFNIADSAISVGIVILAILAIARREPHPQPLRPSD